MTEALRLAAIKLANEVRGSLPLLEVQTRRDMGNSNYTILLQRADELIALCAEQSAGVAQASTQSPRLTDNDAGEITVSLDGKELRGWSYQNDAERRVKMFAAREYVEGWCDGRDA